MALFELNVNGKKTKVEADPEMPLLWAIRDVLGLTGTKFGCGAGLCGSCTVHVDGEATRSCVTPLSAVKGARIVTIEGLARADLHPLQRSWLAEEVSQCGYCQPGQIMAAAALLAKNRKPSDSEIDAAMSDNLCRCGTYLRIRKAIQRTAKES